MAEQITVPPEQVVQELCSDPLGRALWERAQFRVLAVVQAERIERLEKQKPPATEPPSSGWDVPANE